MHLRETKKASTPCQITKRLASNSFDHVYPLRNIAVPLLGLTSSGMRRQRGEALLGYQRLLLDGRTYVNRNLGYGL